MAEEVVFWKPVQNIGTSLFMVVFSVGERQSITILLWITTSNQRNNRDNVVNGWQEEYLLSKNSAHFFGWRTPLMFYIMLLVGCE